jgi:glucose/arabinose dehydrogenase
LALTPDGKVLVTETRRNRIRILSDTNGDGHADAIDTFADRANGLNIPFGMAFDASHFYLGNTGEVRRYAYRKGQARLDGIGDRITELTPGGYNQHWTRNVRVAPDGRLFVTVGSGSNANVEPHPRASVLVMNADGSDRKVFADGLRNPVGMDFHPVTGEAYVTVNERDGLGDNLVPDYFTRIRDGEFFGWPFVYLRASNRDPRRREDDPRIAGTRTPDVLFQAHSAALGLTFYRGDTFPQRYRHGAFVMFRGSWNRHQGTGYKMVFIPFDDDNRPIGAYEDFVTGFLIDPTGPTTFGRPVGVLELPDGSLIFTEEANGFIYRLSYAGTH